MMRVFKTRHFYRWMRKTELTDVALCKAVEEMADGLIDADLGSGVVRSASGWPWRSENTDCHGQGQPLVFRVRIREKRPGQHQ